jgi:hypothetical protein
MSTEFVDELPNMSNAALLDLSHFTSWLASGERGISSEAIVSQLTGSRVGHSWPGNDIPFDPADFRRCELLLRAYPLARLIFPAAMRSRSGNWARLVEHWDELVELIESEVPGAFNRMPPIGSEAPKAHALMQELRQETK